jgi:hypothetical protein
MAIRFSPLIVVSATRKNASLAATAVAAEHGDVKRIRRERPRQRANDLVFSFR